MRSTTMLSPLGWPPAFACRLLAPLALANALPAFAQEPTPVSPGVAAGIAATEARCPTFSWAGVPGASGYEVAIFRVPRSEDAVAAEPVLVSRVSLPAHTSTWTS